MADKGMVFLSHDSLSVAFPDRAMGGDRQRGIHLLVPVSGGAPAIIKSPVSLRVATMRWNASPVMSARARAGHPRAKQQVLGLRQHYPHRESSGCPTR